MNNIKYFIKHYLLVLILCSVIFGLVISLNVDNDNNLLVFFLFFSLSLVIDSFIMIKYQTSNYKINEHQIKAKYFYLLVSLYSLIGIICIIILAKWLIMICLLGVITFGYLGKRYIYLFSLAIVISFYSIIIAVNNYSLEYHLLIFVIFLFSIFICHKNKTENIKIMADDRY